MTTKEKQDLMYNLFGIMLTKGIMQDQHNMTSKLKSICKALTTLHNLTDQECDECLLYFFREYAKGCRGQISDSIIQTQFIPTVKNYPSTYDDFLWAASMITACGISK